MGAISGKIEYIIARCLNKMRRAAGLEIFQGETGEYLYRLVVVGRKADEVEILSMESGLNSLETVAARLANDAIPVFVVLSIRGIIHQIHAAGSGQTTHKLLSSLLPDADPDQLLVQHEGNAHIQITSFARRDAVTTLLDQLRQHGIWVIGLGLGPFTAGLLSGFMTTGVPLVTHTHTLFFDPNGELVRVERTSNAEAPTIHIGTTEMDGRMAPSYGAALWLLLGRPSPVDDVELQKNRQEHLHLSLYLRGRWVALGILLTLLLVNTFFYLHYKDKSRELNAELTGKTMALTQLDSMRQQVAEQKNLIGKTFLNQASRSSFFADRIAASVPDDITLSALDIYPVKGREDDYGREALVEYQNDMIRIKGTCRGSTSYNRWAQYLERQKWTLGVRHLHYADISLDKGAFELGVIVSPSGTPSAPRSGQPQ